MKTKILTIGIFVILLLGLPLATTATEVTMDRPQHGVMELPVGHSVLFAHYLYNRTDFAYDNFTITDLSFNISSDSLLEVTLSRAYYGTDWNTSYIEIWSGQGTNLNFVETDLFEEGEVFNSSSWLGRDYNKTHVIETMRYTIQTPYVVIQAKNIGSTFTTIGIESSATVETYGDRPNEVEVFERETWNDLYPYTPVTTTTEPKTNEDPAVYYLFSVQTVVAYSIAILLSGGMIGGAMVALIMMKQNKNEK